MTERPMHTDGPDDLQTVRLPRVQPPLPGSLDPARDRATGGAAPDAESTAVLSIDDLMSPPPAPRAPMTTPAPARPTAPTTAERLRADAAVAWSGALRRSRTWLEHGDNAVIVATALMCLLLLVVVAAI